MAHLLRDRLGLGFVRCDKIERVISGSDSPTSCHRAVLEMPEVSLQLVPAISAKTEGRDVGRREVVSCIRQWLHLKPSEHSLKAETTLLGIACFLRLRLAVMGEIPAARWKKALYSSTPPHV